MPLAADMGRYFTDAPHDLAVFPHRPRNISLGLSDFLGDHDGVLPQLVD
jgi:hypothetical protein